MDNGTFIGLARNWINGYSSIYLVKSVDWKNGSEYIAYYNNSLFPQLIGGGTEDPFIYIDCNDNFHAIFNNQSPDYLIPVCGGHAYSKDGINWIYTGTAFNNIIQYDDATNFTFSRRERPHFVFGNDSCTPIALTNGAQYGGTYGDATITPLVPLK